jgi:hypothetical protein
MPPEDALVWRVRPVDAETGKGWVAAAVVVLSVAGSAAWGGPLLGLAAALLLGGGIGPFFVTAEYRLSPREVSVRSPFQRVARPWSAFRRAYVGEHGVSLSPFSGRHLLEPYRSVMLRYGAHRDEILDWVRRYGPPAAHDGGT